jgi:antitoxin ParD1/3/4
MSSVIILTYVSLTPEFELVVQEKIASGLYNNASEVMRHALRLMLKRDELGDLHHDWLRAEIEIGWQAAARGDFAEGCTPEKVLARAEDLEEADCRLGL